MEHPTWPEVVLTMFHEVKAPLLAAAGAFFTGWLGFNRPRFNKRTRRGDTPTSEEEGRGRLGDN